MHTKFILYFFKGIFLRQFVSEKISNAVSILVQELGSDCNNNKNDDGSETKEDETVTILPVIKFFPT